MERRTENLRLLRNPARKTHLCIEVILEGKERHKRRGTLRMVAHPEPRIWETEARR